MKPIGLYWGKGVHASFRGPVGLKDKVDAFLKELALQTGVEFSRNDFILNAIRYYLRYLLQSRTTEGVLDKMRQDFGTLDLPSEKESNEGKEET